jgi:hypothetical protein
MHNPKLIAQGATVAAAVIKKSSRPLYEIYGESKENWDTYKVEARTLMIERARVRGMLRYGELAGMMTTIHLEPHDPKFWAILGDVASDEATAKRGLLSVIVVHKGDDMEPGFGFYELAKYFGRKTHDKTTCFIEEMHFVHAQWS